MDGGTLLSEIARDLNCAMYLCTYVRMYVCMYVSSYLVAGVCE